MKIKHIGKNVKTVAQLIELTCTPRQKLQIAKQLLKCAEEVQELATSGGVRNMRLQLANEAVNDWNRIVTELKSELKEENIKRNKVHAPFADMLHN